MKEWSLEEMKNRSMETEKKKISVQSWFLHTASEVALLLNACVLCRSVGRLTSQLFGSSRSSFEFEFKSRSINVDLHQAY